MCVCVCVGVGAWNPNWNPTFLPSISLTSILPFSTYHLHVVAGCVYVSARACVHACVCVSARAPDRVTEKDTHRESFTYKYHTVIILISFHVFSYLSDVCCGVHNDNFLKVLQVTFWSVNFKKIRCCSTCVPVAVACMKMNCWSWYQGWAVFTYATCSISWPHTSSSSTKADCSPLHTNRSVSIQQCSLSYCVTNFSPCAKVGCPPLTGRQYATMPHVPF